MDRSLVRLLVVDDSASMRRVIHHVLSRLGFTQVDEAGDGVEALARLQASTYDLVISDWYMPFMSGLELLRRMRATPALAGLPMLIVTGYVTKDHILEAADAGANGFVVKPFVGASLEEQVTLLLRPKRSLAEAHAMH